MLAQSQQPFVEITGIIRFERSVQPESMIHWDLNHSIYFDHEHSAGIFV